MKAHISLKKTWAAHFNMWINNRVDRGRCLDSFESSSLNLTTCCADCSDQGRLLMNENKLEEAFQIFDKVAKLSMM